MKDIARQPLAAALAAAVPAAVLAAAPACGYRLRGTGTSLPARIRTVSVPVFKNQTSARFELDIKLTRAVVSELVARGKVKVSDFKNFPTAREQGLDVVWGSYYGIAAPPGVDPAVIPWRDDKLGRMAKTKAWAELLQENFIAANYVGGAAAKPLLDQIYQRFLTVLRDVGMSKQ